MSPTNFAVKGNSSVALNNKTAWWTENCFNDEQVRWAWEVTCKVLSTEVDDKRLVLSSVTESTFLSRILKIHLTVYISVAVCWKAKKEVSGDRQTVFAHLISIPGHPDLSNQTGEFQGHKRREERKDNNNGKQRNVHPTKWEESRSQWGSLGRRGGNPSPSNKSSSFFFYLVESTGGGHEKGLHCDSTQPRNSSRTAFPFEEKGDRSMHESRVKE